MDIKRFNISGLILFTPRVFKDSRGEFFESFNTQILNEIDGNPEFCQDNQSISHKYVLRGLHFQKPPWEQGKLVRVVTGSVLDVAVDLRKSSKTYLKHEAVHLSESNKGIFWIPPGFAHGFISLENNTTFLYKCTKAYNQESESGILWNDPLLNINWGQSRPIISSKDIELPELKDIVNPF